MHEFPFWRWLFSEVCQNINFEWFWNINNSLFGSKIFKLQKIRYQYPGQNLIKNFRILQIRSKFFNIPKLHLPPISAKIFTKISEFDDRDMIQTQVEKIIDVDEKNGKSEMVFLWFTISAGHQQLFSIFSFLARVFSSVGYWIMVSW